MMSDYSLNSFLFLERDQRKTTGWAQFLLLRNIVNNIIFHRYYTYMDFSCTVCFCRQPGEPDLPSVLRLQRGCESSHLLDEGREVH